MYIEVWQPCNRWLNAFSMEVFFKKKGLRKKSEHRITSVDIDVFTVIRL